MDNETPDFFEEKDILGFDKSSTKPGNDGTLSNVVPKELPVVYATLGTRILAYLLDVVIVIIPLTMVQVAILGPDFMSPKYSFRTNLISFVVWTLYYGLMESSENQATLGKKICGLMVIDEFGNRLNFTKAALRYLAQIISILPLGFGIWAVATDEKKQGWHDLLLGCYVIKRKK